jgi:hemerythrin
MTVLSWNNQYRIGECTIDNELKELFKLVNAFYSFWAVKRETADVSAALNRLIQHAERHFGDEERIMSSAHYPDLEQHQKAHFQLLQSARALAESFAAQGQLTARDVQLFCKHWLIDHIEQRDLDFRDFLRSKQAVMA